MEEDDEPIFTPMDFVRYVSETRNIPLDRLQIPERVIILYRKSAFRNIQRDFIGRLEDWIYGEDRPLYILEHEGVSIGVIRSGVGAPTAAFVLEELIACGAKEILEVGIAGGIQPNLDLGDIIVVTEAMRDEGASNHYFPERVKLESSERLRTAIIRSLEAEKQRFHSGPVWTTDGAYRETRRKFRKFRNNGALVVNMETSALFAVAKYRQVNIASLQVVSDILSETGWSPAFRHESVTAAFSKTVHCGIEALSTA